MDENDLLLELNMYMYIQFVSMTHFLCIRKANESREIESSMVTYMLLIMIICLA
jgi:hypothetical protein